jgi:hypothetical protein
MRVALSHITGSFASSGQALRTGVHAEITEDVRQMQNGRTRSAGPRIPKSPAPSLDGSGQALMGRAADKAE